MVTEGKVKFMSIDLHTNRFNGLLEHEKGKRSLQFTFAPDSMQRFQELLDQVTHDIFEASTNSFAFHGCIKERAREVIIAHPHKLKLIEPVYVPEKRIRDLRSLFTTYQLLKRQLIQTKNRIHSMKKMEYLFEKLLEVHHRRDDSGINDIITIHSSPLTRHY